MHPDDIGSSLVEKLKQLRDLSGASLSDCRAALIWANKDLALAQGYLIYSGCAIIIRPRPGETRAEAYNSWVKHMATQFAENQSIQGLDNDSRKQN